MADKLTPDQFAESVKKKYPQYQNVPNAQLAAAVIKKYPQYAAQVNMGASPAPAAAEKKPPTIDGGEFKLMSEKAPENARFPQLGRTGYNAADFVANLLPGAGATVGGLQVESGPGAVALAAAGGAAGERAQHYLNRLLYKDLPPQSVTDALQSMGTQALLGAGGEFGARAAGGALTRLAKPFVKSAETVRAADAGTGVRLSPGEASGNRMFKLGESVLEHLPGSAGPLERFRTKQEGDVINMLGKQLDAISSQNLTSEQAGDLVQKAIRDAKSKSDLAVSSKYDEVRDMLGIPKGQHMTGADFERAIDAAENQTSSVLGPNGKPLPQGRNMSAARTKLSEAQKAYRAETARFDQEILGKVLQTQKPEIIGAFFEKAGLDDLRTLKQFLPPDVQQNAARNVLENYFNGAADPQTGLINARQLSQNLKKLGEGRGRLIFGNQYDDIQEASALLNRINASSQGGMMGRMHASQLMAGAATALGGLFGLGGLSGAVHALGTEVVFSRFASLALTRPNLTAGALKILRAAAVSASRGTPFAVNEFISDSPARYPLPQLEAPQP